MSDKAEIPIGFEPYPEMSPFLERLDPLYFKQGTSGHVIDLRILEHNCNNNNSAQGGLLATLADIALGKMSCWNETAPIPGVTTSLSRNDLGTARLGSWIEAAANFHRIGRDLAFAIYYISYGECRLAHLNDLYKEFNVS